MATSTEHKRPGHSPAALADGPPGVDMAGRAPGDEPVHSDAGPVNPDAGPVNPDAGPVNPDAGPVQPTAAQQGSESAAQVPPLRRNLQFQALWAGAAASSLGINVALVAYPLAILALTGSPARAGLFAAVQTCGTLLGGLPAGQFADRHDRRMIVIVGETTRALVTAAVAVGLIFGWLSLAPLLLAGAVLGLAQPVTATARMPLLRSVVAPQQLTAALVQEQVRQDSAALAGPPIAGALYAIRVLGHAVPFLFAAGTFALAVVSAVLMKVMVGGAQGGTASGPARQPAQGHAGAASGRTGMLVGLTTIWSHPVLRAALTLLMMVNTIGAGLELIVIVILRDQHIGSGIIGLVLAAGAVGGLAGAPLVRFLHRLRPGVLLISVCVVLVPVNALFALPFGAWWAAMLLFVGMLGVPSIRVLLDVLVLRQAPDSERGRVAAAVMTLLGLGMPIGMSGAGLLLQYLRPAAAMLTCAVLLAVGTAAFATHRALLQARWPA
jgi:MFS family permease